MKQDEEYFEKRAQKSYVPVIVKENRHNQEPCKRALFGEISNPSPKEPCSGAALLPPSLRTMQGKR